MRCALKVCLVAVLAVQGCSDDGETGEAGGGGAGGSGTGGTAGTGPGGGSAGGSSPYLPGLFNTTVSSLPGGEPVGCEHEWTVRMLHYHPGAVVPNRMYFAACDTETDTPQMFVSLSVGANEPHPTRDATSGAILRASYDPATGALAPTGQMRLLDECFESHGIAVSHDCSTVAVLCRRFIGATDADKDVLATHPDADWMTKPIICGDDKMNDEMWLFEWTDGDIASDPSRYIVHKAIGSWEYGNHYLRFGENDDTYGIAMKTTVGNAGNDCHEADAFLVLDRSDYTMSGARGWSWACGTGHTLFNRAAYNPTTQKYGLHCTTDYNEAQTGGLGAISMRLEDAAGLEYHWVNNNGLRIKGGASALLPLADGGFLGLLIGIDDSVAPESEFPVEPPTSLGLVRFDASGALVGDITWVIDLGRSYVSYPQLAALGSGRYLLGYGRMRDVDDDSFGDLPYRVPYEYYLMEIAEDGTALTEPQLVDGVGWGEQDQFVSLGAGRVGWAYIATPAISTNGEVRDCNAPELQLSVYTSAF